MSAGLLFLHACAQRQASAVFRRAPRNHFIEEELPYADFARSYLTSYSEFPNLQAFDQNRKPLHDYGTEQPPEALLGRMATRSAYNSVRDRMPGLTQAMQGRDIDTIQALLREMLAGVSHAQNANASITMAEHAPNVLAQIEAARSHEGLFGASLCWPTLDAATFGRGGGELAFIVGRPGTGKSWTLLSVAHANHLLGKSVLFVSMEMGLDQIVRRWLGLMTGVNPNDMRTGTTDMHETRRLRETAEALGNHAPIHLVSGDFNKDTDGILSIIDDVGPEVVCIDALYLLRSSGAEFVKKWEALSDVVRDIKRMSLARNIPVISTVQFNRNQGSGKAMTMDNIGGTDSIPQDASVVIGLRPAPPPFSESKIIAEVLKNREGDQPIIGIGRSFNPVRFDEVPVDEAPEGGEDSNEWMV